ncbi:hypothetical protein CR513_48062, partial [Mucuna pruriens]
MHDKSSFNISGLVSQSIWILDSRATYHMTLFPSYFTSYLKELTTGMMIGVAKEQVNGQPQKLGQLLKFSFTINILDIHHFGYLRQCFYIYLQKSLSSHLSVIFANFQSTIVQHFLLLILKVLNLLTSFILMCEGQLVTLYRGLSGLYRLLMIVPT